MARWSLTPAYGLGRSLLAPASCVWQLRALLSTFHSFGTPPPAIGRDAHSQPRSFGAFSSAARSTILCL